jgi:hypothetical protein
MAQKYLIQVTDDLDGTELDRNDVNEVHFGLDGRSYVIDLSKTNATKLRDTLGQYADAARRDQVTGRATPAAGSAGTRKDLDQVRQWANASGYTVSNRGRIPNSVLEAYGNTH